MAKNKVTIYLKSGSEINMQVDSFKATKNALGQLVDAEYKGSDAQLLFVAMSEIEAIVQYI